MKHSNISIFIPHLGCPNQCSFCNQHTIAGVTKAPDTKEVKDELEHALQHFKNDPGETEIAFFGGSFTAVAHDYMVSLLKTAHYFVKAYSLKGIRISTRPDAVDPAVLTLLRQYGVTAVELGAQSMDDHVLSLNDRGHTGEQVKSASRLVKEYGFELGLQMMVGLYGDTEQTVRSTATQLASLAPDTVRIYPTVVLKGTRLAGLYAEGKYRPFSLEQAVVLCADLLSLFEGRSIQVIKLGLHASGEVEQNFVAGIYHPAFRELCESELYYRRAVHELRQAGHQKALLFVNHKAVSKMAGQHRQNYIRLQKDGFSVKIKGDPTLGKYSVKVIKEV